MSHHNRSVINANLVAIILIINFIIIGGLIFANQLPVVSGNGQSTEVALVEPTVTVLPSPKPASTNTPTNVPVPSATPTELLAQAATTTPLVVANAAQTNGQVAANNYEPAVVSKGEQLFLVCSACHGPDARGLPKLGKNLVGSPFIAGLTDEKFLEFVKTGRPIWDPLNTTGIDMPPKGGNPAFTDEDLFAIIAYLRTLRSANTGTAPDATAEASDASNAGATNVQSTANTYDAALVSKGEKLFVVCSACHGSDARGLPKLGKNLVESIFIAGLTDEKFLEFVKTGRPSWDTLNTTGIDMPPKGGNPAFTDDDLLAIIAYIRTLAAQGA